jgi:hypothetical protein
MECGMRWCHRFFMADPEKNGALRIDFGTTDPEYGERIRQAYCGDLDDAMFERVLAISIAMSRGQVTGVPSPVTRERFGRVPRHYVHCTLDRAVTHAGQQKMIAMMDAAMGSKTIVQTLEVSHSPFESQPDALADMLARLARDRHKASRRSVLLSSPFRR